MTATEVVDRIAATENALAEQVRATSNALRRLHQRHETTRQDHLDVLRPYEEVRREAARGLLAGRVDLRGLLTRAEWEAEFPFGGELSRRRALS